jgi:predicted outer membrane repeat protein
MDSPLFRVPVAFLLTALVVLLVTARADAVGVVTNCTNDTDFSNQLAGGGTVTFNCGTATVVLSSMKAIAANTTIDGGGTITLSGNNLFRLFLVTNGVSLTLKNVVIEDGHYDGTDGGAIRNLGSLTVIASKFVNNSTTSSWSGGAIFSNGTLNVSNSVFSSNQGGSAGAILESAGVANISNTSFDHNQTTNSGPYGFGGAVLLTDSATGTITSSTFTQNQANEGGALDVHSGSILNISNSSISSNTSINKGGGIYSEGTLTQTNVTLSGNSAGTGGGIDNLGTATLTNGTLSSNSAAFGGGGIYNEPGATATLTNVTISSNSVTNNFSSSVYGGGIENWGNLTLTNSTLSGNSALSAGAYGFGGGLYNNYVTNPGTVTITNSTINGNSASDSGGGILNVATVTITNSTINANSAKTGGGIENYQGTASLTNVTISGNLASVSGGGIYQQTGSASQTISLTNTLVANGASGANCVVDVSSAAPITSNGYNLSSDGTCSPYFTQPGDLNGGNPNLGPLANNGGPTLTRMPQPLSDAIDSIPMGTNGCGTTLTTDQRGVPRPFGPACDIGSVEYGTTPTATPTPSPTPTPIPTPTPTPSPTHSPTATPHATPTPTLGPSPTPSGLNGDANCDKKVDTADALAILGDAGGITPHAPCQNAEDVDCNGHVEGLDALRVLRWFIGAPMAHAGCPQVGDPLT